MAPSTSTEPSPTLSGQQKILKTKLRRLQKLQERQAYLGPSTPPEVLMEIEDLEREIKNLESELESPTQPPPVPPTPEQPPAPPTILPSRQPSWKTNYQPPLHHAKPDTRLGQKLKGFSPFPRDDADDERRFLFNEKLSGFWSDHPLYSTIVHPDYPDIIIGAQGVGKTAFARALIEIGDSTGRPLGNTLPIYLSGRQAVFDDIQFAISRQLLNFIKRNQAHFDQLDVEDRIFIVGFLADKLTYRRVKWRNLLPPETPKPPPSAPSPETRWLRNLRDTLDLLGFRQVLLAIDTAPNNVEQAQFCLHHMPVWRDGCLMVKLFLPPSLVGRIEIPDDAMELTWDADQLQAMADWRFNALARFANTRARRFGELFEPEVYRPFIEAANGNPRRLARLWQKLETTSPGDREYISANDLNRAIKRLDAD